MQANRRELFAALMAAAAAQRVSSQDGPVTIPGKRPMIVHNDRPEDLETPMKYFDTWVTPVDAFFVRQHIPRPAPIDPAAHRVQISGMVSKAAQLSLADLEKLPQHTVSATLECTGNGRAFYSPKVPGIQWGRGAVGNAEWTGPRLGDVLKMAGLDDGAKHVEIDGADSGLAQTPDFLRSMPMEKAMHPATLLALKMNGESPQIHGFPVRLIVPGWDGTSWVKWVTRLTAKVEMSSGFFMNPGYRYPKYARPPGAPAIPAELEVIEGMPVKSTLTAPEDGAKTAIGPLMIRGFAWAGENAIERVDVSTDGGARWQAAELSTQKLPFAWRLFTLKWTPAAPGYYTVMSRATDTAGRVQPIVPAWNPSGYLWNGIDRVGITVEKA
ncbi:MAG TPA: sulfite oxidase [Candidatus Acidoferrales bacterium]|nr:sulfite oxidase [Candidatus Acidoferrales bacterium]